MIYVKKWEKKEKEMSTKNNIFFNTYLESRIFLNAIIFSEVKRTEENKMNIELAELQELLRLKREEEERLLAEAESRAKLEANPETANANIDTVDQTVTDVSIEKTETDSQIIEPLISVAAESDEIPAEELPETEETTTLVEELPTEESIREKFAIKIKQLMHTEVKVVYNLYPELFETMDFNQKLDDLLAELSTVEDLFEEELSKRGIKNFLKLYSINCDVTSNLLPNTFLFSARLEQSNLRMFERGVKFKINKVKLKKKRKLRKLYIIKKMKKTTFFRKIKRKFFANFCTTVGFKTQFTEAGSNILVKRMPLSQRVIETTNVEFFYKLNKYTKGDLLSEMPDYFDDAFDDSNDLIIYLRNYHQKPYLKLRKARVTHWKLFVNKTIRKQRYKGFINRYVRKYNKLSYTYSFLVNFFTNFKISWFRMNKLESFCKTSLIEKYSNGVVKIPLLFSKIFK